MDETFMPSLGDPLASKSASGQFFFQATLFRCLEKSQQISHALLLVTFKVAKAEFLVLNVRGMFSR
jgi:hypothetical protein